MRLYMGKTKVRSTTVIAVRRNGKVAMAGDGQVTMGQTVMKGNARKVRKIYDGKVMTGFAGATADAFTLLEKFEGRLKEYGGDITRAAVELAKEWRTNKMLMCSLSDQAAIMRMPQRSPYCAIRSYQPAKLQKKA